MDPFVFFLCSHHTVRNGVDYWKGSLCKTTRESELAKGLSYLSEGVFAEIGLADGFNQTRRGFPGLYTGHPMYRIEKISSPLLTVLHKSIQLPQIVHLRQWTHISKQLLWPSRFPFTDILTVRE